MHLCSHVCGGQRLMLSIYLFHSPLHFLEGLSLNSEFCWLDKLMNECWSPSYSLYQCLGYKCAAASPAFTWRRGIWTQVLMFLWQPLHHFILIHFLQYFHLFIWLFFLILFRFILLLICACACMCKCVSVYVYVHA